MLRSSAGPKVNSDIDADESRKEFFAGDIQGGMPIDAFESEPVTILVGPTMHLFYVPKKLLCEKILYFRTCLKPEWREGNQPVTISDIDVDGFRAVVRWLIHGEPLPPTLDSGKTGIFWTMAENAYKAADRLMISELQNKLIDLVIDKLPRGQAWLPGRLQTLRDLELETTPYYQLVLKSFVQKLTTGKFGEQQLRGSIAKIDKGGVILKDVLMTYCKYRRQPWPHVRDLLDRREYYVDMPTEENSAILFG